VTPVRSSVLARRLCSPERGGIIKPGVSTPGILQRNAARRPHVEFAVHRPACLARPVGRRRPVPWRIGRRRTAERARQHGHPQRSRRVAHRSLPELTDRAMEELALPVSLPAVPCLARSSRQCLIRRHGRPGPSQPVQCSVCNWRGRLGARRCRDVGRAIGNMRRRQKDGG
jgi:hypothetical protein